MFHPSLLIEQLTPPVDPIGGQDAGGNGDRNCAPTVTRMTAIGEATRRRDRFDIGKRRRNAFLVGNP